MSLQSILENNKSPPSSNDHHIINSITLLRHTKKIGHNIPSTKSAREQNPMEHQNLALAYLKAFNSITRCNISDKT